MYAGANMGHPSREEGFVLCFNHGEVNALSSIPRLLSKLSCISSHGCDGVKPSLGYFLMAHKNFAMRLPRERLSGWVALLVLGPCCCLPAFSATVRLSEYQKQEWQVEDGLPQS